MKNTLNNTRENSGPYVFHSVWYLFDSNTQPAGIRHSLKNHSPPKQVEKFQKVGFVKTIDFCVWIYFKWEWKIIIYRYEILENKKTKKVKRQEFGGSIKFFLLT